MSRRAPDCRAARSTSASRKAHFPSRLSWAGALWVGCRPKSRNGSSGKLKRAAGPWPEGGMRDALAVDATDARAMRTEIAEDIREPLDQPIKGAEIKGAETDLDITGRRINGHREGIAAATVLDEPTVLPIEPAEAGKGGEGGDFQITNAEFIAAVF